MRVILFATIAAIGVTMTASASAGGPLPDRGDAFVGYRGVDIPHHDADPAHDGPSVAPRLETTGFGRFERIERCETITVRRSDGAVRRIRQCRD